MIESVKIRNDVTGNIIKLDMSEANYLIYEGSIDWGTVDVSHNTFQYPIILHMNEWGKVFK